MSLMFLRAWDKSELFRWLQRLCVCFVCIWEAEMEQKARVMLVR